LDCEDGCQFCLDYTKEHCNLNSGWKASWFQSDPQMRSIDRMQENQNKYASNETNEGLKTLILNPDSKKEFSLDFPSNYTDNLQFKFELIHKNITKGDFNLVIVDKKNNPCTIKFSKQDSLMNVACSNGEEFKFKFFNHSSPLLFSFEKDDKEWYMKIKQAENNIETPLEFIFENSEYFQFNINNKTLSHKIKSIQFSFDNIKKGFWTIKDLSIYNQSKNSEKDLTQNQSVKSDISTQSEKINSEIKYTSKNKVYALYIYNEKYTEVDKLERPESDAKQLNSALKRNIGEFYNSDFISNLSTTSCNLDTFISKKYLDQMNENDIIIVHYGGHGFSYGGSNHWLPINFSAKIEPKSPSFEHFLSVDHERREQQINQEIKYVLNNGYYTIRPIKLLEVLNNRLKDKIIIVISDACRNEIKLDLKVPQTARDVDPIETDEYIEENFSDLNENTRNYLFLQYSVSAFAKASDENSYTSKLAGLISDKNLLYTSNGRIDDILQEVFRQDRTRFSSLRPNSNAIQLNKFNFLIDNWEEFKEALK
jgi:hypothetical protein